jgi:hypothetical protein
MTRNSALFTFLSFIAIPVPVIWKLFQKLINKRKTEEQRARRIESQLGEAIQKVDDIKYRSDVPGGEIVTIEGDIRKLAEEFFKNRESRVLLKKQADIDIETREMRLNAQWWSLYAFLVNNTISLISTYNERLADSEKINYEIADLPKNIYSEEAAAYKMKIRFSSGFETAVRFFVSRPFKDDVLPTIYFEVRGKERRQRAEILIKINPSTKIVQCQKLLDNMNFNFNEAKLEVVDDNYKNAILEILRTIIEHQLT